MAKDNARMLTAASDIMLSIFPILVEHICMPTLAKVDQPKHKVQLHSSTEADGNVNGVSDIRS